MISETVIQHFAANNIPVHYSLPDVVANPNHPFHKEVEALVATFDSREVEESLEGPLRYLTWGGRSRDLESQVRQNLAILKIDKAISRKRLNAILPPPPGESPLPYQHPQLQNVSVDKNWLVPISNFNSHDCDLAKGDTVFHILPSLPQLNSMYWASIYLNKLKGVSDVKIRLDPFIISSLVGYTSMAYKMFVYGVPLDWKDIEGLKEDRHMRWMPDDPEKSHVSFTDAVWSPREDGVHFACEEVPKASYCDERGARYFHSIYSPKNSCFLHADGAIRIYSQEELDRRKNEHVRNSGKSGVRVKVFQVDGNIQRENWCNLVAAFFVWNADLQKYFDPNYPSL
jgi:hypothetical protein